MRRNVALVVALLTLFGFSNSSYQASAQLMRGKDPTLLTVFAASSLAEVFTVLGRKFESNHPESKVQFSFLASSVLAQQILAGAPVDLFASASKKDMALVAGDIPRIRFFATNRVVLAVPKSNPFHIRKIRDLNNASIKWIQCALQVPCGEVAALALTAEGGILTKPISYEAKSASVVAKLLAGEVDAAFVYHTDVIAAKGALLEIPFKNSPAATTKYPIGALRKGVHRAASEAFIAFILSPESAKYLKSAGFGSVAIRGSSEKAKG